MEKETFERIIEQFPKDIKVLDGGAFGHEGENTSVFLGKHFDKVVGFNINRKIFESSNKYPNYEIVIDNLYDYKFQEKFDLVVLDMTIELNLLNDWCEEGLERVAKLLNDGGHYITFVMMTDQYGDPNVTPDLIRWHSKRWWGVDVPNQEAVGNKLKQLKNFELVYATPELRRPYILWVLLKKISG